MHGALDGVRVAGDQLVAITRERLQSEDPDATPVCAALLASSPATEAVRALTDALSNAQGARLSALIRGLEVAGTRSALGAAARVLERQGAEHSAALCRLKAFHRASPGQEMRVAFDSERS